MNADDPAREPAPAGRGVIKLGHALRAFGLDVRGLTCADFGCNVGGFTDCLLRAGAERVYAVDTGYGALAYRLRTDARVNVMERTNALHAPPPEGGVDLVVIDMGWTPQRLCIPAALRWLAARSATRSATTPGRIVTLIKPHYELSDRDGQHAVPRGGVLDEAQAEDIAQSVLASMPSLGVVVLASTRSPIAGGAGKGSRHGNAEWLALLEVGKK